MTDFKAVLPVVLAAGLTLSSSCAYTATPWPESPLEWLLDCPRVPGRPADPHILARTQCAIVTVPRDHKAPELGTLRLNLTRVGALEPQSHLGVVFVQHSDLPQNRHGTLALYFAALWKTRGSRAERTLTDRYDVIELSPRNLKDSAQVEQAAHDLELVRGQLEQEQLHFVSNDHPLGQRYAELYPERAQRRVLLPDSYWQHNDPCVNPWVAEYLAFARRPSSPARCTDKVSFE